MFMNISLLDFGKKLEGNIVVIGKFETLWHATTTWVLPPCQNFSHFLVRVGCPSNVLKNC